MNRLAFQLYTCLRGTESEEENIKMTLCSALYRFRLIISDVDADFVWEYESNMCDINTAIYVPRRLQHKSQSANIMCRVDPPCKHTVTTDLLTNTNIWSYY